MLKASRAAEGGVRVDGAFLRPPQPVFARVCGLAACDVHVKLEGLNPAGSIKLKSALQMIDDLVAAGAIGPSTRLIESSSGNLGVALSMICANRGLRFTCVTDPNASAQAVALMRALGTEVVVVTQRDAMGGFLGTRIELIEAMCLEDPRYLWINQYANPSNWQAHYRYTAAEVAAAFAHVDLLLVGTGTTGTLMGCARYFREYRPRTRIVAVDAAGSVTFGAPPGKRYIPGLGTSRPPEICDPRLAHQIVHVDEAETVAMCRALARRGLAVGGSTGTVLAAVRQLRPALSPGDTVVALSPDMADKYIDTIYSNEWVDRRFPEVLQPCDRQPVDVLV